MLFIFTPVGLPSALFVIHVTMHRSMVTSELLNAIAVGKNLTCQQIRRIESSMLITETIFLNNLEEKYHYIYIIAGIGLSFLPQ